jgi:hypothetical protein
MKYAARLLLAAFFAALIGVIAAVAAVLVG